MYCRTIVLDFDLNSNMIAKTVQYPKRCPVTNSFLPFLMIKVRMIQVIHCPILMEEILSIFTLLPHSLRLHNKSPTKKVFHCLRKVLLLYKLFQSIFYFSLALFIWQLQKIGYLSKRDINTLLLSLVFTLVVFQLQLFKCMKESH